MKQGPLTLHMMPFWRTSWQRSSTASSMPRYNSRIGGASCTALQSVREVTISHAFCTGQSNLAKARSHIFTALKAHTIPRIRMACAGDYGPSGGWQCCRHRRAGQEGRQRCGHQPSRPSCGGEGFCCAACALRYSRSSAHATHAVPLNVIQIFSQSKRLLGRDSLWRVEAWITRCVRLVLCKQDEDEYMDQDEDNDDDDHEEVILPEGELDPAVLSTLPPSMQVWAGWTTCLCMTCRNKIMCMCRVKS